MATKVDELIVEIKAETKGLRAGMSRVNKQLDKANTKAKAAKMSFAGLGKVFAVLGLARVATGIVRTTKTFEDLEATLQANTGNAQETAKALGMIEEFTSKTTFQIEEVTSAFIELKRKGISATREELQGLGNVAAANNQSIEQVAMGVTRAATTSIEQLQMLGFQGKSSGDMITLSYGEGADKLEKTFKKTTANVLEFVAAIGDEKFHSAIADRANTVSGAFSNLGDNIGFFAKAVGEGGLKPVLVEATRGLSKMMIKAKPLGAALGGAIKTSVEALTVAFSYIRPAVITVTAAFAVFAAPAMWAAFSGALLAAVTAVKALTVALIKNAAAWLASPVTWIMGLFALIAAGIHLVRKNIETLSAIWHNTFSVRIPNGLTHMQVAFAKVKEGIINIMNDLLAKVAPVITKLIEAYNSVNIGLEDMEMPDFHIDTTELKADTQVLKDEIAARLLTLKEYKDFDWGNISKEGFQKLTDWVMGDAGKKEDELQEFDKSTIPKKRKEDGGYFGGAGTVSGLEKMKAAFEEMKPAIVETTNAFTNDFVNALLSGESAMDSFKNFAKQMVSQIISSFMQLMVIKPIMDAIMGSMGMPVAAKAGGGTVQAGRPVLVGERGAEMFIPNSSGKIVNNQGLNQMGGGGSTVVNQSISFSTGIIPTVRAEVMKMMPQIADVTKAAVAEGAMRGGSYRRALAGG